MVKRRLLRAAQRERIGRSNDCLIKTFQLFRFGEVVDSSRRDAHVWRQRHIVTNISDTVSWEKLSSAHANFRLS